MADEKRVKANERKRLQMLEKEKDLKD